MAYFPQTGNIRAFVLREHGRTIMLLNPDNYSPDVVSLNPTLFGPSKGKKAVRMDSAPRRPDTELEAEFLRVWGLLSGPELLRDYTGWCDRKWELDFYHEPTRTAIEINGGTWSKSGHSSGRGITRDYDKANECVVSGISLFVLGTDHMKSDRLIIEISRILRYIQRGQR